MSAISVDGGTTMIKAVGYDGDGAESVVVRQEALLSRPAPGFVEQDMHEVWNAVVHTVRGVLSNLDGPVDFIAITAQGDGCWLVDGSGEPTGPAILWNDARAGDVVERWAADGALDEAFALTGSLGFAGLPSAILAWLREHDPDRVARSATALTCGGWMFSRMTGRIAVDTSDASAPFTDRRTGRYSGDVLELLGLGWAAPLLPDVLDGRDRVAGLGADAAAALGVPAGVPVVLAPYDVAATAIGSGAIDPGQACCILGTTLCTEQVRAAGDTDPAGAERAGAGRADGNAVGVSVATSVPGTWLRVLPTLAGGEVIAWATALLGLGGPAELGELAQGVAPGAGGLTFLPYLSPAGERAPFRDASASGSLHGLTVEHTPAHVARAVMEGLSTVIRDCLDVAGPLPRDLRVCGGGAASDPWCQMIADVTGVPASRSVDREIGARGAFVTGAVLTGAAASYADARDRVVRLSATFQPDPAAAGVYRKAYEDFLAVRDVTMAAWPRLGAARARTAPDAPSSSPSVRPEGLADVERDAGTTSTHGTVSYPRRPR